MQGIRAVLGTPSQPADQAAVRRSKKEIKLREMLSGQFAVRTLLQLCRYQMWEGCPGYRRHSREMKLACQTFLAKVENLPPLPGIY